MTLTHAGEVPVHLPPHDITSHCFPRQERCDAQLEEQIFYPAFYEATGEEDLHHEAIIEHDGILDTARRSEMNLTALGEQMAQLKSDLESSPDAMKALGRAKDAGKGVLSRITSAV